jgi:hypothetical protein
MTRRVVENKVTLFEGTFHNEIGLCVQNIDTNLSSVVNTIDKARAIVQK